MEDFFEKFHKASAPEENPELLAAREKFPIGSWVKLIDKRAGGQLGVIEEVKNTADGPALRLLGIGLVPVAEVTFPTEEEIRKREEG